MHNFSMDCFFLGDLVRRKSLFVFDDDLFLEVCSGLKSSLFLFRWVRVWDFRWSPLSFDFIKFLLTSFGDLPRIILCLWSVSCKFTLLVGSSLINFYYFFCDTSGLISLCLISGAIFSSSDLLLVAEFLIALSWSRLSYWLLAYEIIYPSFFSDLEYLMSCCSLPMNTFSKSIS